MLQRHLLVEYLTDELKYVAGRCATPKMLARCPTLRDLVGFPDDASEAVIGSMLRRVVTSAVYELEGQTFMGRFIPTDKLHRAMAIMLGIEKGNLYAQGRRQRVILILGTPMSDETWRRNLGPEREFLSILADHLYTKYSLSQSDTTRSVDERGA